MKEKIFRRDVFDAYIDMVQAYIYLYTKNLRAYQRIKTISGCLIYHSEIYTRSLLHGKISAEPV